HETTAKQRSARGVKSPKGASRRHTTRPGLLGLRPPRRPRSTPVAREGSVQAQGSSALRGSSGRIRSARLKLLQELDLAGVVDVVRRDTLDEREGSDLAAGRCLV